MSDDGQWVRVALRVPPSLVDKIDACRCKEISQPSRNSWMVQALGEYLGVKVNYPKHGGSKPKYRRIVNEMEP